MTLPFQKTFRARFGARDAPITQLYICNVSEIISVLISSHTAAVTNIMTPSFYIIENAGDRGAMIQVVQKPH